MSASRITRLQAILANSHRFIHAVMALEAGLFRSRPAPARAAFATFANNVDSTLYFLAAYLRGVPVQAGDLPDLREDHRALLQAAVPDVERYELVNVEVRPRHQQPEHAGGRAYPMGRRARIELAALHTHS